MTAQLSSGARLDPLAVIRAHAESHRSLAASDAYSAQEAPKLEAALAAVAELVAAVDAANTDFLAMTAVADRSKKIDRERVMGRAAIKHADRLRAALAPFSEAGR